MEKIIRYLKLLEPQNLTNKIEEYDYCFSWKSNLLSVVCVLFAASMIGILFHLELVYFILEILAVIVLFPTFVLCIYKQRYEQKRFADAVTYTEQLLYSFQKNRKVLAALKETAVVFEVGKMRVKLDEAIEYIENGHAQTEGGVLREALAIIETEYDCAKIRLTHNLLLRSEEYGGELDNPIMLLLNDIEVWKRRGYKLQTQKKQSHRDNIISMIVATILCATALYALDAMGNMFSIAKEQDMFSVEIIQFSSFVFILFMLYVLVKSLKNLTVNWLKREGMYDMEYIMSCYRKIKEYDDKPEMKKSIIGALIMVLMACIFAGAKLYWMGIALAIMACVVLVQHKIGYNMAKKDVNDALYMELPQWLMEMTLLLQNNNVQISIIKSIDNASALLQKELYQLVDRIELAPEDLLSYIKFCNDFDVPEAQSCMKILHAISESGTGNARVQISNLMERVQHMQEMADDIRAKELAFQMKMLFSYPVIGATLKLLLDLSVGMFYMFSMIGSIGGM